MDSRGKRKIIVKEQQQQQEKDCRTTLKRVNLIANCLDRIVTRKWLIQCGWWAPSRLGPSILVSLLQVNAIWCQVDTESSPLSLLHTDAQFLYSCTFLSFLLFQWFTWPVDSPFQLWQMPVLGTRTNNLPVRCTTDQCCLKLINGCLDGYSDALIEC